MMVVGIAWLFEATQGFKTADDEALARWLFHFPLIVLLVFCVVLSVAAIAPQRRSSTVLKKRRLFGCTIAA